MNTAVVTGATGFVGSVLAAFLVQDNYKIICPIRGDRDRLIQKILNAATGFEYDMPVSWQDNVIDTTWDFEDLGNLMKKHDPDFIFHSAVAMSFSPLQLPDSFEFNLQTTMKLYELATEICAYSTRFCYISTAYTGGLGEPFYPEKIHLSPKIINPYQATKWAAEMALSARSQQDNALPISIIRPSVIVGHSRTGWYGGEPFGLYSYLLAIQLGLESGATDLRFNIDPEVAHDYLFIDTFIEDIRCLMQFDHAEFSVMHSSGTRNTNAWRMNLMAEHYELPILFGPAENKADRIANKYQAFSEPFNTKGLEWHFESQYLSKISGKERKVVPMDNDTFCNLLQWYKQQQELAKSA